MVPLSGPRRWCLAAGPAEDAEGPVGDPSAGLPDVLAEVDRELLLVRRLPPPAAVLVALRLDDVEGLGHPIIRGGPCVAQVVEDTDDVVFPGVGEARLQPTLFADR